MATSVGTCRGSESITEGVRVVVEPRFLPEQSGAGESWRGVRYVFGYRIRIRNEGDRPVQLLRRRWEIIDADGERSIVDGEGVVGEQPRLEPGGVFNYESFCPLLTPWGTMEGEYTMRRDDGGTFVARVARFYLVAGDE